MLGDADRQEPMRDYCLGLLMAIERRGPIEVWIIDDTGFPKKRRDSVGVTRQYCRQLGKR